ncbi:ATP-dependent helicase C-terminal domain-containing protein, partial [Cellulomonas bogoriensis]|uniref:ATP-dependent helicase C-terminal domain-containing protein n=1 Tax=Cellulomonas bogoriensis TaxID=301388 RepID=UPI0005542E4C
GPGRSDALIRACAPLDEDLARLAASEEWAEREEVTWSEDRLSARRVTTVGAIEVRSVPLERPAAREIAGVVRSLVVDDPGLLVWSVAAGRLRDRLAFCRTWLGDPWPAVDDGALVESFDLWLGPDVGEVRSGRALRSLDLEAALRRLLPWPHAARLGDVAPERLTVPSGSSPAVDYSDPRAPVLSVRLQEVFGWSEVPRLADGRVPVVLDLLSPAGRSAAVTSDLASFWDGGYRQVRAELRGRYPKHDWPVDPWSATASRRPRGVR